MVDVALALADLREKGLVKNVGLTNMVSAFNVLIIHLHSGLP
jgi:aryl-alcohol dehydrogenase-like predicted oxidoreductase